MHALQDNKVQALEQKCTQAVKLILNSNTSYLMFVGIIVHIYDITLSVTSQQCFLSIASIYIYELKIKVQTVARRG